MNENSRSEGRVVAKLFGDGAIIHEHRPAPGQPGRVEIRLDGSLLGSGRTFAQALADALAFVTPGLVRASDGTTPT